MKEENWAKINDLIELYGIDFCIVESKINMNKLLLDLDNRNKDIDNINELVESLARAYLSLQELILIFGANRVENRYGRYLSNLEKK